MMRSLRARRIPSHLVSTKNLERFYCVPFSTRLHISTCAPFLTRVSIGYNIFSVHLAPLGLAPLARSVTVCSVLGCVRVLWYVNVSRFEHGNTRHSHSWSRRASRVAHGGARGQKKDKYFFQTFQFSSLQRSAPHALIPR